MHYHGERRRVPLPLAIANFRLEMGYDYLQALFHRIGLASDEVCWLYRALNMDGDHIQSWPNSTFYFLTYLPSTERLGIERLNSHGSFFFSCSSFFLYASGCLVPRGSTSDRSFECDSSNSQKFSQPKSSKPMSIAIVAIP
ncbi:hypothetical protein NPIL_376691 [Nephila pilipes]|uniref:Uncharacterized protein n=1 Tax=Nephila pilipes TaxID=299642 RepID=A0A8X6QJ09_NEPPI|nr:hypothetical protein NPIL_376691 [Nephila pilipes]